ncbi:MAG: type II toxin-antitoxin system ParD family antitoxin [Candidatus Heimdallarchaeota archaeon]|nr:type II toxin-antitoxin system ParD family antitoxin [Candidatus Heimdallarchaeota archaeon]
MRLITVHFPEEYIQAIDKLVLIGHYPNRSEAIRAAARDLLKEEIFLYDLQDIYKQIPKLRELIEIKEDC